ncbi:MAG: hypothetical protein GWN99_02515 [Gemmatimonadetes bacterium]|uniref:Uncharacterized protein n=1 Tax=Candidatus Kutchimonas denitrificans TaxID=3056748 RepID=A0AAE4Z757_9BACT|nr:hypothetical protein [Gemmatimonadota bacterium]NIR74828.1 hypothetical protein [Candidatus Kutchimonas denitrificans]NIR99939.1 hypothetical protein [Gemmatimonadota bacterium]NIT65523.1 hypothetical protein [Gemmatimonadota bacterium]NIU52493.1 hypothetical protein [Gemmatimonadota bacterium]
MANLRQVLREIHERSLWQIFVFYIILSTVVYEVSVAIANRRDLPETFSIGALVLIIIGLPIVMTTAIVQNGIPALGRSEPTVVLKGEDEEEGDLEIEARLRRSGVQRIFTWRNAIMGGVAAFTLWALAAFGWLLLAGDLVKGAQESQNRPPAVEAEP